MTFIGNNDPVQRGFKQARRILPLAIWDAFIILSAYVVTYSVRTLPTEYEHTRTQYAAFVCVVILTLILLYLSGAYHRIWSRTSGHDVMVLVKPMAASTLIIGAIDYVARPRPLPLSVVLVGNMLTLTGLVAVRYRSRLISGFSWRWRAIWHREFPETQMRTLLVGAGQAGQATAWRLKHHSPEGSCDYKIIGFIDDDLSKRGLYVEGCPILGGRADIPALVDKHRIDLIIVAIHNITGQDFREVLGYCQRTKARIKLIPDVFALLDGNTQAPPLLRDIQPEDLLGRQPISWHEAVDVTPISQKVVLVTGAAGSIGSELCRQILPLDPVRLVLLDNNESGLHDLVTDLQTFAPPDTLAPILADITDEKTLAGIFEHYQPQVIFHSAAYKHVPMLERYPNESIRVNIKGTLQVARLASQHRVERFVLVSTDKAVRPINVMGASKRICEMLMHMLSGWNENQTLFTAVRFGNVLGSRGSVVPTFNRQIEAGGPVTVTDREMTRYFMSIPEAVNLVIHAACLTQGDDLFMLRMGEVVRIIELAERMIRIRGLRPYVDIPIEFTGIRAGEKLHEQLYEDSETLIPTIHPSIVQLANNRNGAPPDRLLDRVNALLETRQESSEEALDLLCSIIGVEH